MGEMEVVSETILGWEIGVKNSKMENWCKNSKVVKKTGQKIGGKFFVQKTEVVEKFCC